MIIFDFFVWLIVATFVIIMALCGILVALTILAIIIAIPLKIFSLLFR